jgi:rubredoxin
VGDDREDGPMTRWRCTACDYVYDPELGDPDGGVPPGTRWEDVPDDWLCPLCYLGKEYFEPEEE